MRSHFVPRMPSITALNTLKLVSPSRKQNATESADSFVRTATPLFVFLTRERVKYKLQIRLFHSWPVWTAKVGIGRYRRWDTEWPSFASTVSVFRVPPRKTQWDMALQSRPAGVVARRLTRNLITILCSTMLSQITCCHLDFSSAPAKLTLTQEGAALRKSGLAFGTLWSLRHRCRVVLWS